MISSLAELAIIRGMVESETPSTSTKPEYIMPRGFTGTKWTNRKSRSKIAKQSKKRNRG